jgi:hypothetical protein
MLQLTVRCHPTVPVSPDELERWVDQQIAGIRASAPTATVRLSRVAQELPGGSADVGWLLELGFPEAERRAAQAQLAETLRDMRLLGFQPTVLQPADTSAWQLPPNGAAVAAGSAASGGAAS